MSCRRSTSLPQRDRHTLFESKRRFLIYLDLRRQGKDLFYYKTSGGYEVDFVAVSKEGKAELIQVARDLLGNRLLGLFPRRKSGHLPPLD